MASDGWSERGGGPRLTFSVLMKDWPLQITMLFAAFSLVNVYDTVLVWRRFFAPAVELYRTLKDYIGYVFPMWVPFLVVELIVPLGLIVGALVRARFIARKYRRKVGVYGNAYGRAATLVDAAIIALAVAVLSVVIGAWQGEYISISEQKYADLLKEFSVEEAQGIMNEHAVPMMMEHQLNQKLANFEMAALLTILLLVCAISAGEMYLGRHRPAAVLHARARLFGVLLTFVYAAAILVLLTRILG